VEAEVEIDAVHLAVGDEVRAGAELVVHGQAHRVEQRFLAVIGAEQLGMADNVFAKLGVPAGECPAADHRGRQERKRGHGHQPRDSAMEVMMLDAMMMSQKTSPTTPVKMPAMGSAEGVPARQAAFGPMTPWIRPTTSRKRTPNSQPVSETQINTMSARP